MKMFYRAIIFLSLLTIYCSCQKEVTGMVSDTSTSDSTGTGTDTTIDSNNEPLTITSFLPAQGKIGTLITIKGTGFATVSIGNSVTINNKAASIVSSTDSTIVIQVLQGTTTGKIAIVVNGVTVKSQTDFIVLEDTIETTPGTWVQKANYPALADNTFIIGFSINTTGYFFKANSLWGYDPATNKWMHKADLPAAYEKNFVFCFVIGGKAYIGLGARFGGDDFYNGHNYNEVWEYNAVQDSWTQKKDFPGTARVAPFSFSINGAGYVGGGDTTNANMSAVNDFWKYDPATDSWSQKANFPGMNAVGFSGFTISNQGYVLGAGSGNPTAPSSPNVAVPLWKYDPATNRWQQKADFPTDGREIISAVSFSINNKGYAAIGAYDENNPDAKVKDDFWEYDVTTDAWIKKADIGGGVRWLGSGFAIGGKGYVGVGSGNTYDDMKNDFWEYTPE